MHTNINEINAVLKYVFSKNNLIALFVITVWANKLLNKVPGNEAIEKAAK
jgi:hypothetical protein